MTHAAAQLVSNNNPEKIQFCLKLSRHGITLKRRVIQM